MTSVVDTVVAVVGVRNLEDIALHVRMYWLFLHNWSADESSARLLVSVHRMGEFLVDRSRT